jgi:hypothetical protein
MASMISYVFLPLFISNYSNQNLRGLFSSLQKSVKLLGLFVNIPLSLFVLLGREFYAIWIPNYDSNLLYSISLISLIPLIINLPVQGFYGVFTTLNKLRINSISVLLFSFIGILFSFLLLNFTDLGIYSIPLAGSLSNLIRVLFVTVPLGAKYLKINIIYFLVFIK